jgi:Patatin-like phospholipase
MRGVLVLEISILPQGLAGRKLLLCCFVRDFAKVCALLLMNSVVFAYASKINEKMIDYRQSQQKHTVESEKPYLIRSYDHWGSIKPQMTERNPGVAHSISIWEAARATTAAPGYFKPIEISNRKFGDGGFGTNNPAMEMFWEVTHMNGSDAKNHGIELILSIGTGESKVSRFANGRLAKYWTYFNAAKKLASDSNNAHEQMENLKNIVDVSYYRFNVPEHYKLGKIKLDEFKTTKGLRGRKESTLRMIERVTEDYLEEEVVKQDIIKVARILVDQRRKRSQSDMWGLVASGRQYRCTVRGCRRCQELRARKRDLEDHLITKHNLGTDSVAERVKLGICPPA